MVLLCKNFNLWNLLKLIWQLSRCWKMRREKKTEQNYMCDCVRSSNLVLQIKSFTSIVLSCRNDMKKTSLWIDPEIEIQSIWAGRLELNSQCATLSYQSNVNWHDGKVSILIKCLWMFQPILIFYHLWIAIVIKSHMPIQFMHIAHIDCVTHIVYCRRFCYWLIKIERKINK